MIRLGPNKVCTVRIRPFNLTIDCKGISDDELLHLAMILELGVDAQEKSMADIGHGIDPFAQELAKGVSSEIINEVSKRAENTKNHYPDRSM